MGLAVAIAMHNIPEGICVAMPIYYATGSKWKVGRELFEHLALCSGLLGTLLPASGPLFSGYHRTLLTACSLPHRHPAP